MLVLIISFVFILISLGLVWFMLSQDHGEKEPVGGLWIAAGFGLVGFLLAGLIEQFIPVTYLNGTPEPLLFVLLACLCVGLIEETLKFVPLASFIYKRRYFNEHTDGIIYFVIAGLVFGTPENILYSLQFGAHAGTMRLILTPIFHASTTGMVGYFLAKSKVDHQSLSKTVMAFFSAVVIHGLYDFGLSSNNLVYALISFMITFAMASSLFALFVRSNDMDKQEGLSVVGHNSFCRACGKPNPNHKKYCIYCGNYA